MAPSRLHDDDWGVETNCFVCAPTNPLGLRLPFFHDTDHEVVVAGFASTDACSGAPTLVHGGVTLAILDEAMAWACIAIGRRWAVTTETTTRFHRPVRIATTYTVEAAVVDHVGTSMRARARVLDGRGTVRAEAEAIFTALGEAQAARLAGRPLDPEHRDDLADGEPSSG